MLHTLSRRLAAFDPGNLRLYASLKGVLASATAGLVMAAFARLAQAQIGALILLAILLCFITQLVVLTPQPQLRLYTLLWGIPAAGIAVTIVALLWQWEWLLYATLAPLIFLSFYVRRFGLIATSLGMTVLFSFYFATLFAVTPQKLGWALLAVLVAFASAILWQNYLWRTNPYAATRRAVKSFGAFAAETILAARDLAFGDTKASSLAQHSLANTSKAGAVIMQQSAAMSSPSSREAARQSALRAALYSLENGLQQMVGTAEEITPIVEKLSGELHSPLEDVLRALAAAAQNIGNSQPIEDLLEKSKVLEIAIQGNRGMLDGEQRIPSIQFLLGAREIAKALRAVESLATSPLPPEAHRSNAHPTPTPPPNITILRGLSVHPTTLLGIQATIAFLLGLALAAIIGSPHPNWIFWTAYAVIAGSTGESLLKLRHRILGTLLGAIIGTLLVWLTPTSLALTIIICFNCLFFALYTRVISYSWMVFWITVMVAVLYGMGGSPSLEVLMMRPLNVLLGSLASAIVVLWLLPFRASDHFKAALVRYLQALSARLNALAAGVTQSIFADAARLAALSTQEESAYESLQLTFPGVAYEYNPLTEARSPLLAQETMLTSMHNVAARLAANLSPDAWQAEYSAALTEISPEIRGAIATAQDTIEQNIAAVTSAIRSGAATQIQSIKKGIQNTGVAPVNEVSSIRKSLPLRVLAEYAALNQLLDDLGEAQQAYPRQRGPPPPPKKKKNEM